jgi:Sec-independent protein translocase protein TatA
VELFGIGFWELVAILLLALIVAGPQRMILWSRQFGRFMGRAMIEYRKAADQLQREVDQMGLDVQIPRTPPTKQELGRTLTQVANKLAAPINEPVREIEQTMSEVRREAQTAARDFNALPPALKQAAENGGDHNRPEAQPTSPTADQPSRKDDFGTWAGGDPS